MSDLHDPEIPENWERAVMKIAAERDAAIAEAKSMERTCENNEKLAADWKRIAEEQTDALLQTRNKLDASIARAEKAEQEVKRLQDLILDVSAHRDECFTAQHKAERRLAEICRQEPVAWAYLEDGRLEELFFYEKDWLLDQQEFGGEFAVLIRRPEHRS